MFGNLQTSTGVAYKKTGTGINYILFYKCKFCMNKKIEIGKKVRVN